MVRVFKCHSFKSATVVPVQDEPLALCTDGDLVFVATRQCIIRIFKRNEEDSNFSEWRCISTISTVEKLVYNKQKNYIITLEQKKSWKSLTRHIRVYVNWHLESSTKASKQRTKVRIAGRSHSLHSSKEYCPQLEVVDLPLDGTVTAFDVCRVTGNFAVAFGKEVKLYNIVEKMVANSDRTYQDVEPFLEMCWNFEVQCLALSEEFLVCCSKNRLQAIAITYAGMEEGSPRPAPRFRSPVVAIDKGRKGSRSSSSGEAISPRHQGTPVRRPVTSEDHPLSDPSVQEVAASASQRTTPSPVVSLDRSATASTSTQSSFVFSSYAPRPISDDDYYQEWSFDMPESRQVFGTDEGGTSSKTIYLHSLHQGSPHPQHGVAPPVLRDFRGGNVKSSSGVYATTVLHLSEVSGQDDWLCVSLIPSYVPEQDLASHGALGSSSSNPFQSAFFPHRYSVCCFVSSCGGGYLYRLNPGVALVSTYRYTDVASKVVAGPHLLQVVTKTGVETYTGRWAAVTLAAVEEMEEVEEVRPPTNLDICLCGIEPFFGAMDISHGTDILALLTKMEPQKGQEDLHWNLYVLQNCAIADLYRDMVSFASRVLDTGPESYLHMVQEAHLLLRWELRQKADPEANPGLVELYRKSCALMGDFYSWPHQNDWHLCLPYYKMSGVAVANVVTQALEHQRKSKEQTSVYVYGQGLMQYLDWALFNSDVPLNLDQEMSDSVLQIYSITMPESLSSLLLLSRLQNYSPDKALTLLSDLMILKESRGEQPNTLDNLARVQVHLLLCDPHAAEMELSSLGKAELLDICSKYPDLICNGATEFTSLGQLMRRHAPSILLQLLADIVGQGDMTMDTCLILLEKNCDVARYKNNQIREFLENLLSDVKRKMWFEEAATLLSEIYMLRLVLGIEAQLPRQKRAALPRFHMPSTNGHFAARFAWLDYLPPVSSPSHLTNPCMRVALATPGFHGQRTASQPVPVQSGAEGRKAGGRQEETCTCGFCLQDLLKLQSLLCSQQAGPELRRHVQTLTEDRQDMIGWDSLWMLCHYACSSKEVAEFAVNRYPHIVAKFAVSTFKSNLQKWQMVLRCMEGRLKEEMAGRETAGDSGAPTQSAQQALTAAYKDVLKEMVELFPAEQFLVSLPSEGSLWFLLPFVSRCLERKHLEELKTDITNKGKSLLMQLNTPS